MPTVRFDKSKLVISWHTEFIFHFWFWFRFVCFRCVCVCIHAYLNRMRRVPYRDMCRKYLWYYQLAWIDLYLNKKLNESFNNWKLIHSSHGCCSQLHLLWISKSIHTSKCQTFWSLHFLLFDFILFNFIYPNRFEFLLSFKLSTLLFKIIFVFFYRFLFVIVCVM